MEPYTKSHRSSLNQDRILWSQVGSNPPTTSEQRVSESWTDSVSGWKDPNWRAKVKAHKGATTPLSGQVRKVIGNYRGHASMVYQANVANPDKTLRDYQGRIYLGTTFASPLTIDTSDAYNSAQIDFYKQARNKLRLLEAGVVVGELAETLRMIRNPAKALRRRIDEYVFLARKRAKGHRAISDPASRRRHVDRAISETWLESQYGMRPLMGDVKSGAEALAESINHFKGSYAIAHGFGVQQVDLGGDSDLLQIPAPNGNSDIRYRINMRSWGHASVRIKGQVAIEVDNPLLFRMELFGFSLSDFIPTVYELIPYSFLVDYFTNLGDVISSWTFPNKRIKWANNSSHLTRFKEVSGLMVDPNTFKGPPNKIHSWHGDYIHFTSEASNIERWPSIPGYPTLRFQIPGLSLKWLNIAGLARARRLV